MPLRLLQIEIAKTLLTNECHHSHRYLMPFANFVIYKNNIRATLLKSLQMTYPYIQQLIGEKCFAALAHAYSKQYPSRSSNLYEYGEYFTHFIAKHVAVKHLLYLPEMAQLEWQCHRLGYLALDTKQHMPAVILECDYPLLKIIDLCQNQIKGKIDIDHQAQTILIERKLHTVMMREIHNAEGLKDAIN